MIMNGAIVIALAFGIAAAVFAIAIVIGKCININNGDDQNED